MPTIQAEQAVYGSFPFWTKGYGLLAKSPGCRQEWVAEFVRLCQEFGEPTSGVSGDGALFCKRLRRKWPWLVVRVTSLGADDRGRPGALAFHGLFVRNSEFAKVDYDPFSLSGIFRSEWTESTVLIATSHDVPDAAEASEVMTLAAFLIAGGHRVLIESAVPIEGLSRAVWRGLTWQKRRECSLATLTFRNSQSFSLAAVPKISTEERTSNVRILTVQEALRDVRQKGPILPNRLPEIAVDPDLRIYVKTETGWQELPNPLLPRRRISCRRVSCGFIALLVVVILAWRFAFPGKTSSESHPRAAVIAPPATTRADERLVEPDERSRLVEGLIEVGERFHVVMPDSVDPTSLMREIDKQLRYRGPWLSETDRKRIERESEKDRDLIENYDRHLQSFRPDRNLPADFADRPLREQVKLFAWSFRLPADPKRSLGEVPHALMDALSVERSVKPSPVESNYPALGEYARFLERLPRR